MDTSSVLFSAYHEELESTITLHKNDCLNLACLSSIYNLILFSHLNYAVLNECHKTSSQSCKF